MPPLTLPETFGALAVGPAVAAQIVIASLPFQGLQLVPMLVVATVLLGLISALVISGARRKDEKHESHE